MFIIGTDPVNLAQLTSVCGAERCEFHSLSGYDEIRAVDRFPVVEVLARSRQALRDFHGPVNAVIGWWDFPVSTMLPILRREFGTPGPTLEAVLKCEHKFYSRLEQRRSVPQYVPGFAVFDPFTADPLASVNLAFPFWIKPVKATASYLGFKVHNRSEFRGALQRIRAGIGRFALPFDEILRRATLPPEMAHVSGRYCIAESIISRGRQCTLEGYVHHGRVSVYGIVDSVREGRARSSFARYQYPSALPLRVRREMMDVTARFLTHIGFDDSPFNVEFYWDPQCDRIWLLEVNTRISKSHCPLFKLVDGEYHHAVNLAVCLGELPDFPHRQGPYKVAAKFMLRRFRDAVVRRVPTDECVASVRRRFPDTELRLHVREGMRLSELRDQDSYSYEVAVLFMGAKDQKTLLANHRAAVEALGFEFDEVAA